MIKRHASSCFFILACLSASCVGAQDANGLWTEVKKRDETGAVVDAIKLNQLFSGLAATLSPAVVNIYTKTQVTVNPQNDPNAELFRYFFGNPFGDPRFGGGGPGVVPPRESQALGSGFVINDQGVIVTNSHVIRQSGKNADAILVKFINDPSNHPGHDATVVGVDELTDVAVIRLKEKPKTALRVAPLANSDTVKVGEWVMAIGNPYGHTHSVTSGIVSALARSLEQTRTDFIQTDASINPGNSGGPLFNIFGEVIGINTAIDARAQGIGFAIPINTAKRVIRQLVEKGEVVLGYIGVLIGDLTPNLSQSLGLKFTEGALIQEVVPGEPAAKAGIKAKDVVTHVNGKALRNKRDFMIAVGNISPGSKAQLRLWRGGKEREIAVTVEERKSEQELARAESQRELQAARQTHGMFLAELSPPVLRQLQMPPDLEGVLISDVLRDSPAGRLQLQPGDVLLKVNGRAVKNVAQARAALGKKLSTYTLMIQRRSATISVPMNVNR